MLFFSSARQLIHLRRAVKRSSKNQVREILLVLEGIGLGQHTAIGMSQQTDLAQMKRHAYGFHILHHVLDRVLAGVFQFLGTAGAAFVDKDQPVRAGQRQEIRQQIVVGSARASVHQHQRRSPSHDLVIDERAMGVHKAFFHGINVAAGCRRNGRLGLWGLGAHCQR